MMIREEFSGKRDGSELNVELDTDSIDIFDTAQGSLSLFGGYGLYENDSIYMDLEQAEYLRQWLNTHLTEYRTFVVISAYNTKE
jgi:hypothetical protein